VKNGVFVVCRSKIVADFLSNEIEVNLLIFYPMRLKLTSSLLFMSINDEYGVVNFDYLSRSRDTWAFWIPCF
jgi:hypothetical protein